MPKIYFSIDEELNKAMRYYCVDNEESIKHFINSAIKEKLDRIEKYSGNENENETENE